MLANPRDRFLRERDVIFVGPCPLPELAIRFESVALALHGCERQRRHFGEGAEFCFADPRTEICRRAEQGLHLLCVRNTARNLQK